ncbi:MAG: Tetratricopeptide repeat, partial [Planctomycetota bacterium]
LAEGELESYCLDGFAHADRYRTWVGSGEGIGVVVFDVEGRVLGARPGPQDPAELAAYLRLVVQLRPSVARARAELVAAPTPQAQLRLGALLLELGARRETERLLKAAAEAGEPDAAQLLARLCALEGRLDSARQWLARCPPSPGASVTLGYLLYKERRHAEAVASLARALVGDLGPERPRARLFFGKALHESGRDAEAIPVLEALIADTAGTTFAGAAAHTLGHIRNPDHGHTH